jgi:hypothetical protein
MLATLSLEAWRGSWWKLGVGAPVVASRRQRDTAMAEVVFDTLLEQIVEDANQNKAVSGGDATVVKKLIQGANIAIGIWRDAAEPNGVGWHVIKGRLHLASITNSGVPAGLKVTGILCTCVEQAIAAEDAFGDFDNTYRH